MKKYLTKHPISLFDYNTHSDDYCELSAQETREVVDKYFCSLGNAFICTEITKPSGVKNHLVFKAQNAQEYIEFLVDITDCKNGYDFVEEDGHLKLEVYGCGTSITSFIFKVVNPCLYEFEDTDNVVLDETALMELFNSKSNKLI